MRKIIYITLLCFVVVATACSTTSSNSGAASADDVIAMVDSHKLLRADLQRDMPAGLSSVDSVTFARMYVDNWVLNQLKISRADEVLHSSYDDIERLVEGYRQSLIMRRLDQYYVDNNIDFDISEREIAAYYRTYSSSFRLDHHKVRGVVVKTPRSFRNTTTLTTALRNAASSATIEEVLAVAERHNLQTTDMLGVWVPYSDFLSNLPTERSRSYDNMLSNRDVQHISTDDAHFYFIITDVARQGEVAPLECVEEDIRRRIFADRRSEIVGRYEDELRREAVAEGRVVLQDSILLRAYSFEAADAAELEIEIRETEESIEEDPILE